MKHCLIKFVRHQYVAFDSTTKVMLGVSKELVNLRSAILRMGYTYTERFDNNGGDIVTAKHRKKVRDFRLTGKRMQTGEPILSALSAADIVKAHGKGNRQHVVSWRKGS